MYKILQIQVKLHSHQAKELTGSSVLSRETSQDAEQVQNIRQIRWECTENDDKHYRE